MLRFNHVYQFQALRAGAAPLYPRRMFESEVGKEYSRKTMVIVMNQATLEQPTKNPNVAVFFPPFIGSNNNNNKISSNYSNNKHNFSSNNNNNQSNSNATSEGILPLNLALQFPLEGSNQTQIKEFCNLVSTQMDSFSPLHRETNLIRQTLAKIVSNFEAGIFSSPLCSNRILLFANSAVVVPMDSNIIDDKNQSAANTHQQYQNKKHHQTSSLLTRAWKNPYLAISLRHDPKLSVWCNSFAQWYLDRTDVSESASSTVPTPKDTLQKFLEQVEVMSNDKVCCLATAKQKMDALVATSQMSHVGLCVREKEYFLKQRAEIEKAKLVAEAKVKDEFKKYFSPASSSTSTTDDISANSETLKRVLELPINELEESRLRQFIVGSSRDSSGEIFRPLSSIHGWFATCFYLDELSKIDTYSNSFNNNGNTKLVEIPVTNRETLSYCLNYFTPWQMKKMDEDLKTELLNEDKFNNNYQRTKKTNNNLNSDGEVALAYDSVDLFPESRYETRKLRFDLTPKTMETFEEAETRKFCDRVVSSEPEKILIHGLVVQKNKVNSANGEDDDEDGIDEDDDDAVSNNNNSSNPSPFLFHDTTSKLLFKYENQKTKNEKVVGGKNQVASSQINNNFLYFDTLFFVRVVTPDRAGEPLKIELLPTSNNNSNNASSPASIFFELHQTEAFQNFVINDIMSSSTKDKNENNNNHKHKVLFCMNDGSNAQDILRMSLLRKIDDFASKQQQNGKSTLFDWCIVDFSAIAANLERMTKSIPQVESNFDKQQQLQKTPEKTVEEIKAARVLAASNQNTNDEEFFVFDDDTTPVIDEEKNQANLFLQENSKKNINDQNQQEQEDDFLALIDQANNGTNRCTAHLLATRILSASNMLQVLEAFYQQYFRNTRFFFLTSSNQEQNVDDRKSTLIKLILLSAGNALTSAPHFDPFVTSCSFLLQLPQPHKNERDILVDRFPLDSEIRSHLITAYHAQTPLLESLGRAENPIASGIREIEELGQVGSDLHSMFKAAFPNENLLSQSEKENQNNDDTPSSSTSPAPSAYNTFIHSRIKHYSAVSGRLNAVQPNIFAISKLPQVRSVFTSRFTNPKTGCGGFMMEADYSQMEVIVLCALTGDQNMFNDLQRKINFHNKRVTFLKPSLTYSEVVEKLKQRDPEVTELRRIAKTFTFQRQYGAGAVAIAASTGMDIRSVQSLIREETKAYPAVEAYFQHCGKNLSMKKHRKEKIEFQLPSGTIIPFEETDANSFPSPRVRNYPVQGLAADLMQIGLAELWRRLRVKERDVRLVNVVHDSVWLDVREEAVAEIAAIVKTVLESVDVHCNRNVGLDLGENKFKVDLQVGRTLAEMKPFY